MWIFNILISYTDVWIFTLLSRYLCLSKIKVFYLTTYFSKIMSINLLGSIAHSKKTHPFIGIFPWGTKQPVYRNLYSHLKRKHTMTTTQFDIYCPTYGWFIKMHQNMPLIQENGIICTKSRIKALHMIYIYFKTFLLQHIFCNKKRSYLSWIILVIGLDSWACPLPLYKQQKSTIKNLILIQ